MAMAVGAPAAARHKHEPRPPAMPRAHQEEPRIFTQNAEFHRTVRAPDITPEEEAEARVAECGGTTLSLALVGVSVVPDSMFQHAQLQHLDLGGNRLAKLPGKLAQLSGLLSLSVEGNALRDLDGVGKLANLTALNARSNQLNKLPSEVCELLALVSLDVGDNALKALPESMRSLSTLEFLRADRNQLTEIPDAVFELANLRNLSLAQNQIAAVPQSISRLEKLMSFDVAENPLGVLPVEVARMPELIQIEVSRNPMRCPPQEVCEEGASAIRGYLEDLVAGESACNTLDVVFIGSPGAGQAAIVSALFDDGTARTEANLSEMNGPRVETWPLGKVDVDGVGAVNDATFRTWCFPGDEVSHEAYQMLLHRRCLFVVTIDIPAWTAINHDQLVQRWVCDIRSRVPSAKVLFVGNGLLTDSEQRETCAELKSLVQQYEEHRQNILQNQAVQLRSIMETREQARRASPQESLRARGWRAMKTMAATTAKRNAEQVSRVEEQLSTQLQFVNGGEPLLVSARSGKGIQELKVVLTSCLSEFLHFGSPVPQKYLQLQRHFEETQAVDLQEGWDSQDAESLAIYWNDFKVQCGRVGISGVEPVRRAAKYLSLVGTILHVPDDAALKPFVFVDPIRLCEAFTYITQQQGVLALARDSDGAGTGGSGSSDHELQAGLDKLRSEGAVNTAVRREICSKLHLPDHIGQVVLSMMARVGILAERPSELESSSAGGASAGMLAALSALAAPDMVVPSLLPEFPPSSLAGIWGGSWSSGWPNISVAGDKFSVSADNLDAATSSSETPMNLQLRRVYVQCERTLAGIEKVSTPLLGCALARLTQRVAAEPCIFWQHGACMAVQHEFGVQGARVLVEHRSDGTMDSGQQPLLTVTVRSTTQALIDGNLADLWGRIDDCVRSAAEQQPGSILASYVACPFCQAKGKSPFLFTATEISEAWRDGERMLLSPGVGKVPMELLQPPSCAEAADADIMSARDKRVDRVTKQLDSHLSERLLKLNSSSGGASLMNMAASGTSGTSPTGAERPGEGTNYTDDEMDALEEKRTSQKGKYAIRMGFFRSDAKSAVARSGNPNTLREFQHLVPKVLKRCHIPDDQAAWLVSSMSQSSVSVDKLGEESDSEGVQEENEDLDLSDAEDTEAESLKRNEIVQRLPKAQVCAAAAITAMTLIQ